MSGNAAPVATVGTDEARRARRARLLERARALRKAYLQIFGIPDYRGYVEHMAARHPGEAVLSQREFFACAIDRKYSRKGPRCC
ncbi:MAG TPA: YbdD/YjiX family protein [Burkholderiaceae bacterium]|nr:YbdD/YjiX family protein [Burkholderiaceae bacterium]